MSHLLQVWVDDLERAERAKDHVHVGHYFVFVDDLAAAGERPRSDRFARLLVKPSAGGKRKVVAVVDQPHSLGGVTFTPPAREIDPLTCLVSDRDLYRAEQDTVNLLVAAPATPADLRLVIECNGEPFSERELQLDGALQIETLAGLLPGSYRAQLAIGARRIGNAVSFTVADYTLAPLSGRLVSHRLERQAAGEVLVFELDVESYQLPFDGKLQVALVEAGRELKRITLKPEAPGRYRGAHRLKGEGPFRLRLTAADDAERVAEVALPGSRAAERQLTVVNELGREVRFSLMPEAGALPVRGGFLSEGDTLATPLRVERVLTDRPAIRVEDDVEALVLVRLDLATGRFAVDDHGAVKAGSEIAVPTEGPMTTVFCGAFVDGRPFEGVTGFFAPSPLELQLAAPETLRPREDLVVELRAGADLGGPTDSGHPYRSAGANQSVPVLLCVRDERLTAADRPQVALAGAAKRGIDRATAGMDSGTWLLDQLLPRPVPPPPWAVRSMMAVEDFGELRQPRRRQREEMVAQSPMSSIERAEFLDGALDDEIRIEETTGEASLRSTDDVLFSLGATAGAEALTEKPMPEQPAEPPRAEFPELLFYGIVPVRGSERVTIPLGDSLGRFTVEAFALKGSDWAEATASVVVDQPVRADLELPPAVHPDDHVVGRLRAAAASGRARVRLTRDGQPVSLRGADGQPAGDEVATPAMLAFDVKPGSYRAEVEEPASGERDAVELIVAEPGKFKAYAKVLGLMQPGEAITLDSANALSLRVLPAVDGAFDQLVTATADYSHLCCEQTAAKILAATFMYLTAESRGRKRQAEQIILSGIAREKRMLRPGKGFAMYPDYPHISDHYSRLAVRYLWTLRQLDQVDDLSPALRRAARQGVELADTAARAHSMARVPRELRSAEDAYAAATTGGDAGAARALIDGLVDFSGRQVAVRDRRHAVAQRALLAYAAATLIALQEHARGICAANEVTRQFNEQGALYSTVDSVAAIVLMIQLRASGLVSGEGRLRVNGEEMTARQAAELADQVESVEVIEGVAAVQATLLQEEDWDRAANAFPVRVGLRDGRGRRVKTFKAGQRCDLVIALPDGYQVGDLAHVALPACLAWIEGGGKVKRLTADFAGRDELRLPLVVTHTPEGQQRFAVCVRNMFEQERAASPGLITVGGSSRWW